MCEIDSGESPFYAKDLKHNSRILASSHICKRIGHFRREIKDFSDKFTSGGWCFQQPQTLLQKRVSNRITFPQNQGCKTQNKPQRSFRQGLGVSWMTPQWRVNFSLVFLSSNSSHDIRTVGERYTGKKWRVRFKKQQQFRCRPCAQAS